MLEHEAESIITLVKNILLDIGGTKLMGESLLYPLLHSKKVEY